MDLGIYVDLNICIHGRRDALVNEVEGLIDIERSKGLALVDVEIVKRSYVCLNKSSELRLKRKDRWWRHVPLMAPLTKSLTPRLQMRLLLLLCCCGDVARSPFAPGALAARMAKFTGPAVLYTSVSKVKDCLKMKNLTKG